MVNPNAKAISLIGKHPDVAFHIEFGWVKLHPVLRSYISHEVPNILRLYRILRVGNKYLWSWTKTYFSDRIFDKTKQQNDGKMLKVVLEICISQPPPCGGLVVKGLKLNKLISTIYFNCRSKHNINFSGNMVKDNGKVNVAVDNSTSLVLLTLSDLQKLIDEDDFFWGSNLEN